MSICIPSTQGALLRSHLKISKLESTSSKKGLNVSITLYLTLKIYKLESTSSKKGFHCIYYSIFNKVIVDLRNLVSRAYLAYLAISTFQETSS